MAGSYLQFEPTGATIMYSTMRNSDYRITENHQPLDTVNQIIWDPYKQDPCFLTAGWDGVLRYYMVRGTEVSQVFSKFLEQPILSLDISQQNIVFVGLASGHVAAVSLAEGQVQPLGKHEGPVIGMYWIKKKGCLLSLDMGTELKCWDVASSPNFEKGNIKLPCKTVTCALDYPVLLIGSINSTVCCVNLGDFPNCSFPTSADHYSSCKIERFSKMTCSVVNIQTKVGAIGTFDGRIFVFEIQMDRSGRVDIKNGAVMRTQIKRVTGRTVTLSRMVNAVDVGYYRDTPFAIVGGSDEFHGLNLMSNTRIAPCCESSTTAARLSPNRDYLVYATGNDWMKGLKGLEDPKKPCLHVRKMVQSDLDDMIRK